jgi:hypothetical protein
MRKLKLDLGELEVQSFPTADAPTGREGTVHGMIVSTDQVPHCQQEPGVSYYNVGLDASFNCLAGIGLDSADLAFDNVAYPGDLAAQGDAA